MRKISTYFLFFFTLNFAFQSTKACERKNPDAWDYVEKNELCDDDLYGKKIPRFDEFKSEIYVGPASPINFASLPDAENWKTAISRDYNGGINFAGHYVIANWGCGAGCIQNMIIDTKTGKIFQPQEINLIISRVTRFTDKGFTKLGIKDDGHIHYEKDSSLLVAVGKLGEASKKVGVYFFRWDGKRLHTVSKIERNDPQ